MTARTRSAHPLGLPLAFALVLSACVGGTTQDLSEWMVQQRNTVKPKVEPVAPPKAYAPQTYSGASALSPFSEEKLTRVLNSEAASTTTSSLLAAEINRRKEALELVPLDAIAMVGLLDRQGKRVALVKSNDLLYQVEAGNYLGQNYGRITNITETQITLREIIQDAAGDWVERAASLELQEGPRK